MFGPVKKPTRLVQWDGRRRSSRSDDPVLPQLVHRGVLAHSTHLRGAGTYDPATGQERLRVQVTLATAIPEAVCRAVNLGYRDPASIDVDDFAGDPDTLVVPRAGEVLFRLR